MYLLYRLEHRGGLLHTAEEGGKVYGIQLNQGARLS